MDLTRRQLIALLGTSAAVATIGTEALAKPKPNRSAFPLFEVYENTIFWKCSFCDGRQGKTFRGPEAANPPSLRYCTNGCHAVHYKLESLFDDIVRHAYKTGDTILSADEPQKLLVGFVAIDYRPQAVNRILSDKEIRELYEAGPPVTKQWYIPGGLGFRQKDKLWESNPAKARFMRLNGNTWTQADRTAFTQSVNRAFKREGL